MFIGETKKKRNPIVVLFPEADTLSTFTIIRFTIGKKKKLLLKNYMLKYNLRTHNASDTDYKCV